MLKAVIRTGNMLTRKRRRSKNEWNIGLLSACFPGFHQSPHGLAVCICWDSASLLSAPSLAVALQLRSCKKSYRCFKKKASEGSMVQK